MFSCNAFEHIPHISIVLLLLQKNGNKLKLLNCRFFTKMIEYIELVIGPGKLKLSDRTTDAIRLLKPSRTVLDLKSFLCSCSAWQRFVPNFACFAAPFNQKLKMGEPRKFDIFSQEEHDVSGALQNELVPVAEVSPARTKVH